MSWLGREYYTMDYIKNQPLDNSGLGAYSGRMTDLGSIIALLAQIIVLLQNPALKTDPIAAKNVFALAQVGIGLANTALMQPPDSTTLSTIIANTPPPQTPDLPPPPPAPVNTGGGTDNTVVVQPPAPIVPTFHLSLVSKPDAVLEQSLNQQIADVQANLAAELNTIANDPEPMELATGQSNAARQKALDETNALIAQIRPVQANRRIAFQLLDQNGNSPMITDCANACLAILDKVASDATYQIYNRFGGDWRTNIYSFWVPNTLDPSSTYTVYVTYQGKPYQISFGF